MSKRKKKQTTQKSAAASAGSEVAESAPAGSRSLSSLRNELDQIDSEILAAINRRGAVAQKIGQLKQADGRAVFDAERESKILQQTVANNVGPLSDEAVRAVFRELISGTRAVQTPLRVAYLGPEFT